MTSTTEHPPVAASFRLVGGKGGVGKTTCAAALAVAAARAGRRTLVISTDPAPSLGDALGQRVGSNPKRVSLRRGSLHAVEIDARRSLDAWLEERRERLERIAYRGTWLDRDDVARLLRLSLPGIDEIAGLLEIARHGRSGRFDVIVVDTAPTGHTLRMLSMPDVLRGVARVFDDLQEKHRVVTSALTGEWRGDAEDDLIEELDRDGRHLAALLRDRQRVRVSWVTLAEPMAVEEALDAARILHDRGIPLADVVFNAVTPLPETRCRRCTAMRAVEASAIATLRKALPGIPLSAVRTRDREPVGTAVLQQIGAELERPMRVPAPARRAKATWSARSDRAAVVPREDFAAESTRLLMFGGKGGVGKTTCASAAAIHLARDLPQRRILLVSTDPAHSLSDALGHSASDRPRTLPAGPRNLHVRELDAATGFEAIRERYAAAIDALFDRLSRGTPLDVRHDRIVLQDLLDLAPPGIDELVAVADVLDALEGAYDLVVIDTAPSGHALRLLETPALVHDWAKALMAIVLKYQPVTGVGALGEILLRVSQAIGRLRTLLADGERTAFVPVTRAAALPRLETMRLVRRLERMHIAVPLVIVNAFGKGTCGLCQRLGIAEARELARLTKDVTKRRAVVLAPARLPPPHGPAALAEWRSSWSRPGLLTARRAARRRGGR